MFWDDQKRKTRFLTSTRVPFGGREVAGWKWGGGVVLCELELGGAVVGL